MASAGENVSRALSRYGFDYRVSSPWQHAEMLHYLVPLALVDAYELVGASAPDDDRSDEHLAALGGEFGLQPWEVEAALDGAHLGDDYFRRWGKWTEQEQREAIEAQREDEPDVD